MNAIKAIVDTHALIWFLEGNPRLGKKARAVLDSPNASLIVPVIVLGELYYYLRKNKRPGDYAQIFTALSRDQRIAFRSIDADLIPLIPDSLELHDGLIAAILKSEPHAALLSCDSLLKKWNPEKLIWD